MMHSTTKNMLILCLVGAMLSEPADASSLHGLSTPTPISNATSKRDASKSARNLRPTSPITKQLFDRLTRNPNFKKVTSGHKSKVNVPIGGVAESFNNGRCKIRRVGPDDVIRKMLAGASTTKWRKTGVPKKMWGLWWATYTTTVNTFLHNRRATTRRGVVSTTDRLGQANVWTDVSLKKLGGNLGEIKTGAKNTDFRYRFDFEKKSPSTLHNEQASSDGDFNYADVTPNLPIFGPDSKFWMEAEDTCSNCGRFDSANNPSGGKKGSFPSATSSLSSAQKSARRCKKDTCWRRYSKVLGFIPLTYDLVKIADQFGNKIQPNFDNWKSALEKEGDEIFLATGQCA
jgi:hypothetical protein